MENVIRVLMWGILMFLIAMLIFFLASAFLFSY